VKSSGKHRYRRRGIGSVSAVDAAAAGSIGVVRSAFGPTREGDDFTRLVQPYLAGLGAHCYRMLGSSHDADDALQDALLRAWRGFHGFDASRALQPWLYKVATNACLDAIAKRSRRKLPSGPGETHGGPEPAWIEPYADQRLGLPDGYASPDARYEQREAVELAFVAALQHVTPRQRAVLILRDVLGFSANETAELVDTSPASVNSAVRRARQTVEKRLPVPSQLETIRSLGDERLREIARQFMDAFESGDVQTILAVLAEDVAFSMPEERTWCRGRDAVSRSWLMPSGPPRSLRYIQTRANGQLAFGVYRVEERSGQYLPLALDVVSLRGTLVVAVAAFRAPEIFSRFALPDRLPPAREGGVAQPVPDRRLLTPSAPAPRR
jgi:RNA polymerase sigma-70 factor (ECF subfamily)